MEVMVGIGVTGGLFLLQAAERMNKVITRGHCSSCRGVLIFSLIFMMPDKPTPKNFLKKGK
ncbi:MAG: hypothetical protein BGO55_21545 [Sphingobacteriales bacterium 50-39]|nr:MAG: hypothetical protein BGO55_21545 [Sphingobacteriales bacterium 50-39]